MDDHSGRLIRFLRDYISYGENIEAGEVGMVVCHTSNDIVVLLLSSGISDHWATPESQVDPKAWEYVDV